MIQDELDLEELSDSSDAELSDKLKFPCLVLEGIVSEEELKFLAQYKYTANTAIPLYIKFNGITKRLHSIDMTLDAFQMLGFLANYKITLHKTPTDSKQLCLRDAKILTQLIKL